MAKFKVTYLVDFGSFKKGESKEVSSNIRNILVTDKIAEDFKEVKPKKEK